ncbi:MAG: hypothetical protein ACRDUX_37025 [Mycobacterium sp.]
MSPNTSDCSLAPRRLHIALDFLTTPRWVELTPSAAAAREMVRITAPDLRAAQRATTDIHANARRTGDKVAVLVDVDAMIAEDARTAMVQMDRYDARTGGPTRPGSLRYVGTPGGLAGLIGDVFTAGVADGVTLRPLSPNTFEHFLDCTLPALARFGVTVDPTRIRLLEGCRRRHRAARATATPTRSRLPATYSA